MIDFGLGKLRLWSAAAACAGCGSPRRRILQGQLLNCGQRPQHIYQQQAHRYNLSQRRIVPCYIAGRPSPQDHLTALALKPMDFVRSGGFTMSRFPLSPSQPRLAAVLKNSTSSPALTSGCSTSAGSAGFFSSCSAFNRLAHGDGRLPCSTFSGVECLP